MSAGGASARLWGVPVGFALGLTLLAACERRSPATEPVAVARDAGPRNAGEAHHPRPPQKQRVRHAWKIAASAEEPERLLAPGERIALPEGAERDLDLGLAVRLHVRGPAVLASDPDGERAAYVLQGALRVSVGADPGARPYGLALGTPCGLLTLPRAGELALSFAGTTCSFNLLAGYATLAAAGAGLEQRTALTVNKPLLCAAGAACRETPDAAPQLAALDPVALGRYEALVGEELERAAAQLVAIQASERAAVATLRPGPRSDDALALQRKLAQSAAEALRTRARVGTLRATQRAVALVNGRAIGDDSRERRVRALLGEAP